MGIKIKFIELRRGNMDKKIKRLVVLVVCLSLMMLEVFSISKAKTGKVGAETGYGYEDGKYVYYAFEMDGVRMGIRRYNTKTKESKEIFSYKINGKESNGFYNISVKGNYIYAVWDQYYGTGASETYIYRIAKDGSKSKRLACGDKPVIIGNRIYYEKCKVVLTEYGTKETVKTGKMYTMKLDGSNKKKAGSVKIKKLSSSIYSGEKTDIINGYSYFIKGKSLYREKVNNGKTKKLMTCSNGVTAFYVCGHYILVRGSYNHGYKMAAYIIKTNGKGKRKLASWGAAE